MRQRTEWRGFPARLILLVGVVLGLAMSLLVSPAPHSPADRATHLSNASAPSPPGAHPWTGPSAKVQPAPLDRGSANVRNAAAGQPLAETARAFGSSRLAADATEGSDQPLFLSRAWTSRSPGAVRQVLDTVAPRLGRAPPSYRAS